MIKDVRKILIIELWAIGDVVMMSAVLKPLLAAFPNAQITVLCQEHGREVLGQNKEISSFVIFKFPWTVLKGKYRFWNWDWKGILSTIALLRREKFDLVLDGRGDVRDDVLAFLVGPRRYVAAPHRRSAHRVDSWTGLLKQIGLVPGTPVPSISVSFEEQTAAKQFVRHHFPVRPRKLIGVHPGASGPLKRWPLQRFKEIVGRIKNVQGTGTIIFSDQAGYGSELGQDAGLPVFKGDIRQLAAVLTQLDILVCNDTGVMHMASALGVPVAAIFGPGDPKIFGPRPAQADIVIKDCKHRTCFGRCGKVTADCLLKVDVDDVWSVVSRRL